MNIQNVPHEYEPTFWLALTLPDDLRVGQDPEQMQDNHNQSSSTGASIISKDNKDNVVKGDRRQTERRCYTRYLVSAGLEAIELESRARITGRMSDLSLGGCYVDTVTTVPVGAVLKIRIAYHDKFFETKARVIASSAGMGMSLRFAETEPGQLKILEAWIAELSGELLPSEPELPEIKVQPGAEAGPNIAQLDVLDELIIELMRTGALLDPKGRELLKKLRCR